MRVYISGAVTGTTDYKERFTEAEKKLSERGYEVVNPVRELAHMADKPWIDLMEQCLLLLNTCDKIHLLDGWNESRGACMEFGYAVGRGILQI